jgi:hypothetical protein
MIRRASVPRAVSAGRGLLAIALLLLPNRCAALASFGGRRPAAWLVRLLGARMLAQSGLELASGSRRTIRLGAATDAVHAASMLVVAARRPGYRPAALASAGLAGACAAVGALG